MNMGWALALTTTGVFMLLHVMSTYSALGRVILHTGAMSHEQVLPTQEAEVLNPQQLHNHLVEKTAAGRKADINVMRFYRMNRQHAFHSTRNLEVGDSSSMETSSNTGSHDD
jgi:hypothetical protein